MVGLYLMPILKGANLSLLVGGEAFSEEDSMVHGMVGLASDEAHPNVFGFPGAGACCMLSLENKCIGIHLFCGKGERVGRRFWGLEK